MKQTATKSGALELVQPLLERMPLEPVSPGSMLPESVPLEPASLPAAGLTAVVLALRVAHWHQPRAMTVSILRLGIESALPEG